MANKPHVVIILPTYNEAENIGPLITKLHAVLENEKKYQSSILVVDDRSPDGTADRVRRLMKQYSNIELLEGKKEGLGAAYIRGMQHAVDRMHADILFEMDADLSHDPALIPSFLRKLEEGYDYVVGCRYIKGGSIPRNWPWYRKIFSVGANLIVRYGLMLPQYHEWSNGYRAIRSPVFQAVSSGLKKYRGYTFQIAFLHRAIRADFRVGEIPCEFFDRTWGKSKIIPYEYIPNVFRYVFLNSSFVKFFITGTVGFSVDFAIAYFLINSFDLHKPTANALSGEVAIATNFTINNFWSFSHKRIRGGLPAYLKKFLHFNFVASGAIAIQWIGMYLALDIFGDRLISAEIVNIQSWLVYKIFIIILFIIPYSYFMYNRFIWPHSKNTHVR